MTWQLFFEQHGPEFFVETDHWQAKSGLTDRGAHIGVSTLKGFVRRGWCEEATVEWIGGWAGRRFYEATEEGIRVANEAV